MKRILIAVLVVLLAMAAGSVAAQRRIEPGLSAEVKAVLLAPPLVPPAITRTQPARVIIELETTEVKNVLADGV
ncbi:MAG TPA: nitrite reductase, copper-containing, partial [Methylomirabilota bacterium]|nr:nitrite reductase, copper-containing [Methylomirabilota bacterium]